MSFYHYTIMIHTGTHANAQLVSVTVLSHNALRADSQKSYPTGLVDLEEADIRMTAKTLKICSDL